MSPSHCLRRIPLSGTPLTITERINYFGKKGSRYSLPPPRLLETGENSFSSFNFIVAIFNGSIFQRFVFKPIVRVFCWSFLQCIYFMVWPVWPFSVSFVKCKAPFLVASPASLRKYSSFVIVKTINGENLKKKKTREKMYNQKETILKEARGEELIELRWHMTKIIRRNSSGNWVILNFSGQKP